ncbi:MAG TPA: FadR/GntR family transcriptional regulator [Chloroflexota bacterium]|jgi:GntR family transcriptional repressor for pyruvate dehydrogenase complex|nr:FadR/GntR family transcriptional regulator [Chloroflexota bacterium]
MSGRFPPRGARLHQLVVRDLIERIGGGELAPGALLPTEPELCQLFEVSRSVVRDAVRVLAEKGLVDVRPGRGTTVTPVDHWDLLDPVVLDACLRSGRFELILDEVLELRTVVEVQVAGLAARKATPEELTELERLVAELAASVDDPERYSELDSAFHEALAAAVNNSLLLRVARPVFRILRAGRGMTNLLGLDLRPSQWGHEAIFAAVARRDPEGARRAMGEHIALFEESLRRGLAVSAGLGRG